MVSSLNSYLSWQLPVKIIEIALYKQLLSQIVTIGIILGIMSLGINDFATSSIANEVNVRKVTI